MRTAKGRSAVRRSVGRMEVSVRRYAPDDAAALATVMWRSVRVGALADYSGAQTEAWLPAPRSAEEMHRWASDGRTVFVTTTEADGVVGYLDVEADGHIDHLYRVPEVTGAGVAGITLAAGAGDEEAVGGWGAAGVLRRERDVRPNRRRSPSWGRS